MKFGPLSLVGFILVSACATHAPNRTEARNAQLPAPITAAPAEAAPQAAYPNAALTADLLFELLVADIAAQRGQYPVAVEAYERAARTTKDPRLAERAATIALYAKDYAKAVAAGEQWVALQPGSTEAHEVVADALMRLQRPDEAAGHFAQILELSSPQGLAHSYLKIAAALGRQSDRDAAVKIMQSLVERHPNVRESHYALAHLAVRTSDLDLAEAAIDRALALSPDWEDGAVFKARVLVSKKDAGAAKAFFERFLRAHPGALSLRMNYARYLIDLKDWDKARAEFKRVTEAAPQDGDAAYAVGLLALQANRHAEAEQYLRRTIDLQPDNDQARLYLGQMAEQLKRYDDAMRWYKDVDDGQLYIEAQARVAMVLAAKGDLKAAREHLHSLQPDSPQQRVQLVLTEDQILRDARMYKESLAVLTRALEATPDEGDLLYARALVAEKLDLIPMHESDLRRVLQKDAKNAHALNALGYTLADRTTRYQEALDLIQQALAVKPDDAFILDSMGWVQYRLGNYDEAVKYLKRAFSIRADAEISAHLGEVLWMMGERNAAEDVWRAALRDTPDNEALLTVIKKFKQ